MEKLIEITEPNEMEKFVKSSNYLLVDDGLDEYVIHESDLLDYIINRNEDINVYNSNGEFILSTIGFFLNKISYDYRQKIIERLIRLRLGEEETKETYYCESTILDYMQSYLISSITYLLNNNIINKYFNNNISYKYTYQYLSKGQNQNQILLFLTFFREKKPFYGIMVIDNDVGKESAYENQ